MPHVFDSLLRVGALLLNYKLLDWLDEIQAEVLIWPHTNVSSHQYGGMQFNCKGKEIGHLHSNGLLDVLYSRRLKAKLIADGRIQPHHLFKQSGWISFYIQTNDDVTYAKKLLSIAYQNAI